METENTPVEQPAVDSVEDRAARIFGDDHVEQAQAPQEAATQETETVPETFEFDYDGEKFNLPKKLEKAVMQEKDYTQKSQSLAEIRKDVERQMAQIKLAQSEAVFQQSVKAESDQIAMIEAVLGEYGKLEWAKFGTDELVRKKLEMDQYKDMKAALESQIGAKKAQFDQHYKTELEKLKADASETLKKRVNWTEETDKEVRAYVRELGYSDAEYDNAHDPRAKQMAWEAAQYRKMKAGAQPAIQQAKAVKTGSSSPMPQAVKERLNFNKALQKTKPGTSERRHLVESRAAQIFG